MKDILDVEKRTGKRPYRVLADASPGSACVYINQHSKDENLRPLLQDRRFRVALSVAVNRPEIVELIYAGLAEPSNAVSSPFDSYYLPEFSAKHVQYDPDEANRLLDEIGMKRGRDGLRRMPDGSRFRQTLNCLSRRIRHGVGNVATGGGLLARGGLDFVLRSDAGRAERDEGAQREQ